MAVLAAGFTFAGCDVVEDVTPKQSVTPDQALNSVEGYEALLVSGYDALQAQDYYGQQFMLVPDALADNLDVPIETSNRYPGFTTNAIGSHLNRWGGHYNTINEMNLILSRIGDLEIQAANAEAVRSRITGEAYFLRAINYFDLVRAKGYEPGEEVNGFDLGVIIRTEPTTSVADADFRARSTVDEVYSLIESDIAAALAAFGSAESRSRPVNFGSLAATQALKARVNLYQSDWDDAEAAASAALAATSATLVTDSTALIAANLAPSNPESIFEIQMTVGTDGAVTNANASLQSLTDPFRGGFFDAVVTPQLVAAHEDGDNRLGLYDQATVSGEDITYILKYQGAVGQDVDPIPVFRTAEMYLILAEARLNQGNVSGAEDALNTVRNARGLDDFDNDDDAATANSNAEIYDAIVRERRVELAFEGHRFFDLKRLGRDIPKPQIGGGTVIPYTNFRILAQIPEGEVSNNSLLVQNPGYGD